MSFSKTGQIKLPDQVKNYDFEDIAISKESDGDYIYVGDIGHNFDFMTDDCHDERPFRMVHIFREPDLQLYR